MTTLLETVVEKPECLEKKHSCIVYPLREFAFHFCTAVQKRKGKLSNKDWEWWNALLY